MHFFLISSKQSNKNWKRIVTHKTFKSGSYQKESKRNNHWNEFFLFFRFVSCSLCLHSFNKSKQIKNWKMIFFFGKLVKTTAVCIACLIKTGEHLNIQRKHENEMLPAHYLFFEHYFHLCHRSPLPYCNSYVNSVFQSHHTTVEWIYSCKLTSL